jgi:iron-sulfur cluster assembly accessory protein
MSNETIILTQNAAARITHILKSEPVGTVLRVSVEGGGCSGFQYRYDLVADDRSADDLVLVKDDATVLIDAVSQQYLDGAEIDFVDDLIGQSFQIRNPNASASCGCGTSFSL